MPLDPRILLGGQPAPASNPLEMIQAVTEIQGLREQTETRRLAAEKARQTAADEAAIRRVLTETNGDIEAALPRLRTIAPKAALEFETEIGKARSEKFQAATHQMTARTKGLDFAATMASLVAQNPASASAVRDHLQGISEEIRPLLPQSDDPAAWSAFADLALTAKDRYEKSQANLKLFGEGKLQEALGGALSTATNAEEWAAHIKGFLDLGGPKAIAAQFGDYSPENVARAATLAITPTKRAELAGQAAGRAQTAAHQAVIESQGAQRITLARQRLAKGTGTEQDRESLMQAVINNPGLWDQITPTERGKIAGELNTRGFTGFGKPLSDAAVKQISDSEAAIASLTDLREILKKNEQYIGPIAGFAAINPYSDANKARADIDRVRQRVGKTLEGGVLRKEDEEKYKKILATLTDVPSTAIYKIDQLEKDIKRDIEIYKHQQRLAGRRVPATETKPNDPMGIR